VVDISFVPLSPLINSESLICALPKMEMQTRNKIII
jgi:hypothetical protein